MFKKLCFLLVIAIFLTACGASSPSRDMAEDLRQEPAGNQDNYGIYEVPSESLTGAGEPEQIPQTTEAVACDAEYFLFTRTDNTLTDDDGMALVQEKQTIPRFSSMDLERSEWIGGILDEIDRDFATCSRNLCDYAKEFISLNGTEHFYRFSNYLQLAIARHDGQVISLLGVSSVNSGGAHPSSVQTAWNLDPDERRILRLEDVIEEDRAGELAAMVRAGVDAKFNALGLFEDYAATIEGSMLYGSMTPYWYFNDTGLVIFYNQYELGPYAAGIIKAELPYADLEGILMEEYFPAPGGGQSGDLCLRWEGEDGHRIPITLGQEGGKLLVGVIGSVYQVQISEVMWMEDMPIAQELLFSALSLGENDILELTGVYHDETSSFVIEFTDGRGVQHLYHIREGDLTDDRN